MAKVDPFLAQIPRKLLNDAELRPFFEYFVRWAHDMWVRTGGGSDAIESQAIREAYGWNLTSNQEEAASSIASLYSVKQFQEKRLRPVKTSTNYTALPNEFIKATNGCLITFPQYALEDDELVIKNGDGSVINLNGNGRLINGFQTGAIKRKNTAIRFYYFADDNTWEAA